jgi:hypothetical protein
MTFAAKVKTLRENDTAMRQYCVNVDLLQHDKYLSAGLKNDSRYHPFL